MTTNQQAVDAAALVTKARTELDKLLQIQELLTTELPAAQRAYDTAFKKLREATRPDRAASRKYEIETLNRKIAEANSHVES